MARSKPKYIVDEKGRKQSVVLPIREYEELLEDLADLALIAERRNDPTVSLESVKDRIKARWMNTESS